jgi:hypothetical protein
MVSPGGGVGYRCDDVLLGLTSGLGRALIRVLSFPVWSLAVPALALV